MSRKAGLLAFALCLLLPASAAHATYDPLSSGTATISLASSFRALMKSEGLRLSGRKGVKVKGQRTVLLPVSGGEADPTIARGSFELGGELVLSSSRSKHSIRFTFLTVNAKPSPLYAKVGGGQQKVAKAKKASFLRSGFAYGLQAEGLALSAKTATRLDTRLKIKGFEAGQSLGGLRVSANPTTVTILPQGRATLVLDPTFTAKLAKLFVSRNPVFPAEHQGDTFTLPIATAGQLAPDASQGTLRTEGSIELLQLGAGQLFWREPWFQPGQGEALGESELDPSPPYPGKQGQVGIFSLGAGQVSADPSARTITVTGAPLALTALAAKDLNEGFSEPLEKGEMFAAGEAAGAVSFTAQGQ
jgi:hypothetical protein